MTEEEIQLLIFENQRLKEDLRLSDKNWKFENERIQLSLNARLVETTTLTKRLQVAEARLAEVIILLNIATKQNETERHDDGCNYYFHFNDLECSCWLSKVKKELCK